MYCSMHLSDNSFIEFIKYLVKYTNLQTYLKYNDKIPALVKYVQKLHSLYNNKINHTLSGLM